MLLITFNNTNTISINNIKNEFSPERRGQKKNLSEELFEPL